MARSESPAQELGRSADGKPTAGVGGDRSGAEAGNDRGAKGLCPKSVSKGIGAGKLRKRHPKAVMLENVRGLLDPKFDDYRAWIMGEIDKLGYNAHVKLLHASDFGVPQIRPRVVIVGIRKDLKDNFEYPASSGDPAPTVGHALRDLMAANGWRGVDQWVAVANGIAPTIVGGSKKHGGPDLGPTRARRAWATLGVDGLGIANEPPARDFIGNPKLTKEMIAVIQGFPLEWNFGKKKTAACRMIGNAFPPPVASAVGKQIKRCSEK